MQSWLRLNGDEVSGTVKCEVSFNPRGTKPEVI